MKRPDFALPRLFVQDALAAGQSIPLSRDQSNYLGNVLRLSSGDPVLVFNGQDGEWRATVDAAGRRAAALSLIEQTRGQPPLSRLTYTFAPLKHARLDYMVQKAVEMGAGVLQPVLTRRTQVSRVNLDRMRANAIEAAEQCGVLNVPEIGAEMRLDAWLASWPAGDPLVFCDEDADVASPLAALKQATAGRPLALLIGPEGGFEESERQMILTGRNALRLSLGPRILRADTAAVAALALVQATVGDWR